MRGLGGNEKHQKDMAWSPVILCTRSEFTKSYMYIVTIVVLSIHDNPIWTSYLLLNQPNGFLNLKTSPLPSVTRAKLTSHPGFGHVSPPPEAAVAHDNARDSHGNRISPGPDITPVNLLQWTIPTGKEVFQRYRCMRQYGALISFPHYIIYIQPGL